ncbi:hypothetical protein GF402_00755 [Candidatus Fermentibacteria bacterium]|nr:hypothetical protein [Candidatus Fermentibacteria bacterium]
MASSLLLALAVFLWPADRLDLNSASPEEIGALEGVSGEQADSLHRYIYLMGGLENIYQLTEVEGIGPSELEALRRQCILVPPEPDRLPPEVLDVMEKLASEDSPGDAAVAEWENLLVRPLPVNEATSWDLRSLDRVSLVDAAAVERRLRSIGPVSSIRSLRSVENLSYYGYRNMRDFVSTRELDLSSLKLFGSYRMIVEGGAGRDSDEEGYDAALDNLGSALFEMSTGGADYSGSPVDSALLYEQLQASREELLSARGVTGFTHRVSGGLGDRMRGGVRLARGRLSTAGHDLFRDMDMGEVSNRFDQAKAFVSLHHLGPLRQVVLGNYRLALGQGLLVDNSGELMYRRLERPWGLHPDLTSTRQFALTGAAVEARQGPFLGYGFLSSSSRDAILSQNGVPNVPAAMQYRCGRYTDALIETTYGGYCFADLGGILPTGTAVGLGGMSIAYDDSLFPDADYLDVPNDGYYWDCPEYRSLEATDGMTLLGVSGQTVVGPMSLEGELSRQDDGASAFLIASRWQNDYFYLTAAARHYDLGYSNPYCRGFSEQKRYDDTVFEKPYYLTDPLVSQLQEWPTPKPEEGVYLESRFQVSDQVVFPKLYLDVWRSLPYDFDNHRFQGEVEYRADFPVRFRLKYKYQSKTKMHDVVPTTSRTHEYTLRSFFLPFAHDYFDVRLRLGMVELTPNPLYGDDRLLSGGYLSARWEHDFSDRLSVLGGTTLWTTDGMSQWEFEDTGIDFLDGDGTKFYLTFKNALSDNLQLRFRVLRKDTFYPRTGLYRPDPEDQFHYQGDPDSAVRDFGDHVTGYGIRCQLDFRW